jgi:hypothetical protein
VFPAKENSVPATMRERTATKKKTPQKSLPKPFPQRCGNGFNSQKPLPQKTDLCHSIDTSVTVSHGFFFQSLDYVAAARPYPMP